MRAASGLRGLIENKAPRHLLSKSSEMSFSSSPRAVLSISGWSSPPKKDIGDSGAIRSLSLCQSHEQVPVGSPITIAYCLINLLERLMQRKA
jgi:hypothetical protein